MLYILAGFVFGCMIPYLARRIGKLMPATMGYILLKTLANVSISHTQRCVFSLQRCNSFRSFSESERSDKNSERSLYSCLFLHYGFSSVAPAQ